VKTQVDTELDSKLETISTTLTKKIDTQLGEQKKEVTGIANEAKKVARPPKPSAPQTTPGPACHPLADHPHARVRARLPHFHVTCAMQRCQHATAAAQKHAPCP